MTSAQLYERALEMVCYSEALTRTKATGENSTDIISGVARGMKDYFLNKAKIELEKVK